MTPNQEYKSVFGNNFTYQRECRRAIRAAAQAEWDDQVATETLRLNGGKKRGKATPPDEWFTTLRAALTYEYNLDRLNTDIEALEKQREDKLYALAPSVVVERDESAWYMVKVSHSDTWRTQGYGMNTYARGELLFPDTKLKDNGFNTYIRFVKRGSDRGQWGLGDYGRFELWADCQPWLYDALSRTWTVSEWRKCLDDKAINARVYNAFLPYDDSYRIS